ncbi:MAG: tetratricopeptide repeat protein [Planctomycetota bacterium]
MDNPILHIAMKGQRALEEGRLVAALAAADQLVSENPHQSRFRWFRANVFYELSELADAASEAHKVVSLEPDFYPAHFMLAVCADQLNRRAEAQEHFEIALDLSNGNHDVLEEYALFMAAQRPAVDGERVARSAVEQLPDSPSAWTSLGIAQMRLNEMNSAEAALQRALEIDPTHGPAKFVLGSLYVQTGRRKTAQALSELIDDDVLKKELREELARSRPRIHHPLNEEDARHAMNPTINPARTEHARPWANPLLWAIVLVVLAALLRIVQMAWP